MKRGLVALVAVGFVVAAISIGRAHSGDDVPREANPSSSTAADVAKDFDRDLTTEQTKRQSEQVLQAQEDIRKQVAEMAKGGSHTLIVTIREEHPGDVWVAGKVAGKPACVTPPKKVPSYITVSAGVDGSYLVTKTAPLEANLLKGGACQATLQLFVHPLNRYTISVAGAGHDKFDRVLVRIASAPQEVTIVG